MGVMGTKPGHIYTLWNVQPEAKPVAVTVWRGGEAIRQKGRLEGRAVSPHLLGVSQKNESQDKTFDIQEMDGCRSAKSQSDIEADGPLQKEDK
jgi:hypothetical protein